MNEIQEEKLRAKEQEWLLQRKEEGEVVQEEEELLHVSVCFKCPLGHLTHCFV